MPDAPVTPGMRVLCRDAEWLVTRVDPSDYDGQHHAVHCVGADDLVRGHQSIFLTQLDAVIPVDPRKTQLTADTSSGYRLARLLSRRTDSRLLTTATPHKGQRETFGRLISLLDPSTMPDPRFKEYDADEIRGFFLMRLKEDVRDEAGDNLSERQLVPLDNTTCDASDDEEAAYAVLAELREAIAVGRKSDETKHLWKNNALVQYGLYKLFSSSPEACQHSLEGRVTRETEAIRKIPNCRICSVYCSASRCSTSASRPAINCWLSS